jgi:undecaprenyl-diphosphatase
MNRVPVRHPHAAGAATVAIVLLLTLLALRFIPLLDTWVSVDRDVHRRVFDLRSDWLTEVMRFVSDLVDWVGAVVLVVVISILAFRFGHRREALFMALTAACAYAFSTFAKEIIGRDRPDSIYQAVLIDTPAFPSGHAVHSVAFYGAAALLLTRWTSGSKRLLLTSAVILLALLIGTSRVYLGVHWPTDVIGGWLLGGLWLTFCWSLFRWYEEVRVLPPDRVGLRV